MSYSFNDKTVKSVSKHCSLQVEGISTKKQQGSLTRLTCLTFFYNKPYDSNTKKSISLYSVSKVSLFKQNELK